MFQLPTLCKQLAFEYRGDDSGQMPPKKWIFLRIFVLLSRHTALRLRMDYCGCRAYPLPSGLLFNPRLNLRIKSLTRTLAASKTFDHRRRVGHAPNGLQIASAPLGFKDQPKHSDPRAALPTLSQHIFFNYSQPPFSRPARRKRAAGA
jgi:hypothetical protein